MGLQGGEKKKKVELQKKQLMLGVQPRRGWEVIVSWGKSKKGVDGWEMGGSG